MGVNCADSLPQVSPQTTKLVAVAVDVSRLSQGEVNLQAPSCGCWQDSISHGLFDLADWWLEEALQSLPHEVLHRVTHSMAICFIRASKQEKQRERGHNLLQPNLNVKSYHFCYILFIRRKSLHQANTPKKMIRQGHKCQQMRSWGHISETPYHNVHSPLYFKKYINNLYFDILLK